MSFEQHLQHVARNALEASADALAPDVLARLAAIRQTALTEAGNAGMPARWAPRMAMAATLLFAVGVWTQARLPSADTNRGLSAQVDVAQVDVVQVDVAPVTAQIASAVVGDMALLDDLEFVAWMALEARDDAGGGRYEG